MMVGNSDILVTSELQQIKRILISYIRISLVKDQDVFYIEVVLLKSEFLNTI